MNTSADVTMMKTSLDCVVREKFWIDINLEPEIVILNSIAKLVQRKSSLVILCRMLTLLLVAAITSSAMTWVLATVDFLCNGKEPFIYLKQDLSAAASKKRNISPGSPRDAMKRVSWVTLKLNGGARTSNSQFISEYFKPIVVFGLAWFLIIALHISPQMTKTYSSSCLLLIAVNEAPEFKKFHVVYNSGKVGSTMRCSKVAF